LAEGENSSLAAEAEVGVEMSKADKSAGGEEDEELLAESGFNSCEPTDSMDTCVEGSAAVVVCEDMSLLSLGNGKRLDVEEVPIEAAEEGEKQELAVIVEVVTIIQL